MSKNRCFCNLLGSINKIENEFCCILKRKRNRRKNCANQNICLCCEDRHDRYEGNYTCHKENVCGNCSVCERENNCDCIKSTECCECEKHC